MSSIHADPPPPIVTEPTGTNYATGPALGKGGFAICHRAERYEGSKPTGHLVALKIVKTKMEPAKLAQKFVTELQIHSKLAHPNIVTFYRAFSFCTSTYVVLELCPNGSLADMLKKRKYLTLPEIRRFVIQICGAVKYLHHRHIVHRDLKTGNLFLDEYMNVKVGDFGLAALLVSPKEMEVTRRTTMCGTPNYLAPEILQKDKGHDEKVDLWAIGVIAYTLAVGKAPFHASTKEEIYKKLRSGNYTWPELTATANQSSDLRALVSSLLVTEEHRPTPDKIVSQNFFKIAFVPTLIPTSAKERAPSWAEVGVPSVEVLQRGYSDTWYRLCKESGVGEAVKDQPFPLNGGRKIKSIVYDMSKEAQAGNQPTMPLPKDLVYVSPVSDWNRPISTSPEPVVSRIQDSRSLQEISHNEVALARLSRQEFKGIKDTELMPPPVRPPTRTNRSGTVRKAARTISEEAERGVAAVVVQSDITKKPIRPSRLRTASSAAVGPATLRENGPSSSANDPIEPKPVETDFEFGKPQRSSTLKRSADASLARRPRSNQASERSATVDTLERVATLDELRKASPVKKMSRKRAAENEPVPIHEDRGIGSHGSKLVSTTSTTALPASKKKCDDTNAVKNSQPDQVLRQMRLFHDNLSAALARSSKTQRSIGELQNDGHLPFVSRWVDYSRKHGVGYVLSDGTVGCVINSSAKSQTPVTHVLVRNGARWLRRVGKNFENIDQVPLEVLEDQGEAGIVPRVYKGLGSVKEGPLAVEADRRRTLSILWVKFGRYMCQSLDGDDGEAVRAENNFVRFYQRIGNVGIWAFADGCVQVHFPDHTKLVLSATGSRISATCISTDAAAYLSSEGTLLPHHVTTREVFEDSVSALLYESDRVRARIVRANHISEKLQFIASIVGQWNRNGGLGRLDNDFDQGQSSDLHWKGLSVTAGEKKMDRVTVGRHGGDEGVKPIPVSA